MGNRRRWTEAIRYRPGKPHPASNQDGYQRAEEFAHCERLHGNEAKLITRRDSDFHEDCPAVEVREKPSPRMSLRAAGEIEG